MKVFQSRMVLVAGCIACLFFSLTAFKPADKLNNDLAFQKSNKSLLNEVNVSYSIVSAENFSQHYSNYQWLHIARIQKQNPNVDLKTISEQTDWSKIVFIHDLSDNFAYRLYDGDFLIIQVKN